MSLAQTKTEISRLPEMLEQRRKLVDEFLAGDERIEVASLATETVQPARVVATPEMLARRREISRKFQSGEWSVDLPSNEEIKADARQKDPSSFAA
jgi:hypothetical protein